VDATVAYVLRNGLCIGLLGSLGTVGFIREIGVNLWDVVEQGLHLTTGLSQSIVCHNLFCF
jgi:hypothetical protein